MTTIKHFCGTLALVIAWSSCPAIAATAGPGVYLTATPPAASINMKADAVSLDSTGPGVY